MNLKTRKMLFVLMIIASAITLFDVIRNPGWLNILILFFNLAVVIFLGLSIFIIAEVIYDDGESEKISYLMNTGSQHEAALLAEEKYRHSLEQLGPNHVNTIHWALTFSRILQKTGDSKQARDLIFTARRILRDKPPKNQGLHAEFLCNLADLYGHAKLFNDATGLLDEAEQMLGSVHQNTTIGSETPVYAAQKLRIDMCRVKIMVLNGEATTARTKGWDLYAQAKTELGSNNAYTLVLGNMLLEILNDPGEIKALSEELMMQLPTL